MTSAMTRTRTHRQETEWEKFCRIRKKRLKRFFQRHLPAIILIGLPLIGLFAGLFIGVKATNYAQSVKINDYGRQIAYTTYTVKSGDTVWGIAQDLAALNPEYNDIRQYVAAIERVNKLVDGKIQAGEIILIPYYISPNGMDYNEIYSKYGIGR